MDQDGKLDIIMRIRANSARKAAFQKQLELYALRKKYPGVDFTMAGMIRDLMNEWTAMTLAGTPPVYPPKLVAESEPIPKESPRRRPKKN